ncbi:DUF6527 family protein [Chitinophaga sp. S165]|uniref:DUF6527 family protein n=1 Tax=Chitinophaga sp. S165 TaxID=2135462 RepID=UPI000D93EC63|nr:hypothetical protein C7475_109140 [Chitinophaga sp. S165]
MQPTQSTPLSMIPQILTHEFVEFMPDQLEDGKLYVSITCSVVVHKCACGCGNEVVIHLSPSDWKLTFDGETISLSPSVGNWQFPCRSHYWVRKNMAIPAIESGRNKSGFHTWLERLKNNIKSKKRANKKRRPGNDRLNN